MQKELPVRKIIRLQGYDYSREGCYHITICVKDRHEMLGKIVGTNCVRPLLSDIGNIAEAEISQVVMPNHIHMIVRIENSGRTQFVPTKQKREL